MVAMAYALSQLARILVVAAAGAVLSAVVTPIAIWILRKLLKLAPRATFPSPPAWLTGSVTGFVEIVVFATALALGTSGALPAMIAWNAIKLQAHWQIFTKGEDISRSCVAIIGGLLSIFFALLAGYVGGVTAGTWH
jgi:hypothetical protein